MYRAVDLVRCRNLRHKFRLIGSDKTPMKLSLVCLDESVDGVTAMAAHGDETQSWGIWKKRTRVDQEAE